MREWTTIPATSHLDQSYDLTAAKLDALVFQALQTANKMELAFALHEAGSTGNVVVDRYWPSAYAYGVADGLDGEWLIKQHELLPQPDVFVLLDIDAKTSSVRRPERRDRYEQDEAKMEAVEGNYRGLWKRHPTGRSRWIVLNGDRSVEEVHADLKAILLGE